MRFHNTDQVLLITCGDGNRLSFTFLVQFSSLKTYCNHYLHKYHWMPINFVNCFKNSQAFTLQNSFNQFYFIQHNTTQLEAIKNHGKKEKSIKLLAKSEFVFRLYRHNWINWFERIDPKAVLKINKVMLQFCVRKKNYRRCTTICQMRVTTFLWYPLACVESWSRARE